MSQRLNRSTAYCICAFGCVVMFAIIGCGRSSPIATITADPSERISSTSKTAAPVTIDAGVVLADRSGYLCFPLEQIGLPPDANVTSIESSCECVHSSIVGVETPRGVRTAAVLLEFTPEVNTAVNEVHTGESKLTPANLGVIIVLKLADGATHQFNVNLLHSLLAVEDSL